MKKFLLTAGLLLIASISPLLQAQQVKGTYFLEFNFEAINERNRRMGSSSTGVDSALKSVVLHWSLVESNQPQMGRQPGVMPMGGRGRGGQGYWAMFHGISVRTEDLSGYLRWNSGIFSPDEWRRIQMRVGQEFRAFTHSLSKGQVLNSMMQGRSVEQISRDPNFTGLRKGKMDGVWEITITSEDIERVDSVTSVLYQVAPNEITAIAAGTSKGLVAFDYFNDGQGFRGFTSPVLTMLGGPTIVPVPEDPEKFAGNVLEIFFQQEGRARVAQYFDENENKLAQAMELLQNDLAKGLLEDVGLSEEELAQITDFTKIESYLQTVEQIVRQEIGEEIARHEARVRAELDRWRRDVELQASRAKKEAGRWWRDINDFLGL